MATNTHHILLVEDNPADARLVEEAFKTTDTEIEIHIATDGDEAIEFFRTRGDKQDAPWPSLTLLDLNLPGTSGLNVLETIQEEESLRRIPVIIFSSSTVSEDIEQSYKNNANAYLAKPSTPTEYFSLANAVEEFWLETAQLPPTPT